MSEFSKLKNPAKAAKSNFRCILRPLHDRKAWRKKEFIRIMKEINIEGRFIHAI